MEMLEKVERLREKANVTYEEARAALEAANGDLLDAMVLLERQGKVKNPGTGSYSTSYEEQKEYIPVKEKVEEQQKSAPRFGQTLGKIFRTAVQFIRSTSFIVSRGDRIIFTMPTWVCALLLFFFWEVLFPVMVIVLFFGVRYSFEGERDAETANRILRKAGSFAEDVRNEFTHGDENDPQNTDFTGGR